MPSTHTLLLATALCSGLLLAGCDKPTQPTPPDLQRNAEAQPGSKGEDKFSQVEEAYADINAVGDHGVSGKIRFRPDQGKTRMVLDIKLSGLTPGKHGFHIHQHPNCGGDGAEAAGGHFNPQEARHGAPDADSHHTGDLGNITADDNGEVDTQLKMEQLSFSGPNNILHHSVVVHADADDLSSQPSGAAGERVGCGVIRPERDVLPQS